MDKSIILCINQTVFYLTPISVNKSFINKTDIPPIRLLACDYVNLQSDAKQWNYSNSFRPYWRLYWNDRCGAIIRSGKQVVRLCPSMISLVPPNVVISSSNNRLIKQFYVHFQLLSLCMPSKPVVLTISAGGYLSQLIKNIARLFKALPSRQEELVFAIQGMTLLVFAKIVKFNIKTPCIAPRIMKTLAFIQDNLPSTITNAALAKQAGLSTNAFIRVFKAQMGIPPHIYLRQKRLEKAGILLHYSNASIKQISEDTGFCDRYHFSHIFKQFHGVGPAEFRQFNQDQVGSLNLSNLR